MHSLNPNLLYQSLRTATDGGGACTPRRHFVQDAPSSSSPQFAHHGVCDTLSGDREHAPAEQPSACEFTNSNHYAHHPFSFGAVSTTTTAATATLPPHFPLLTTNVNILNAILIQQTLLKQCQYAQMMANAAAAAATAAAAKITANGGASPVRAAEAAAAVACSANPTAAPSTTPFAVTVAPQPAPASGAGAASEAAQEAIPAALQAKRERALKILRYKMKLRKWREANPISRKYSGRSNAASSKPRIKGRFVKKNGENDDDDNTNTNTNQ